MHFIDLGRCLDPAKESKHLMVDSRYWWQCGPPNAINQPINQPFKVSLYITPVIGIHLHTQFHKPRFGVVHQWVYQINQGKSWIYGNFLIFNMVESRLAQG